MKSTTFKNRILYIYSDNNEQLSYSKEEHLK